jgi:hypothetical protein
MNMYLLGVAGCSPIRHLPIAKVPGYIGESTADFRQLAKFQEMHWRNYSGPSPIGESEVDYLSCHGTILI